MFSNVLLSHSLSLDMLNNFCFHLYAQKSLSHSHTLISLSHLTLSSHSFTHSWHAEQLLFSCLCWKVTLSLSHSLTLTLSHSHTLTLSHSFSLSLSTFLTFLCSKVAVYRWKWQCFFLTWAAASPSPVTFEFIELVPS